MKPHLVQDKVRVKKSSVAGYGVFANQDILPFDVIEECYTLFLSDSEKGINNFLFSVNDEDDRYALPLGSGCIFNHADQPNADYFLDVELKLMIFKAEKLIKKDEEIFISYGKDWFDGRAMPIKRIPRYRKIIRYLRGFPLRAALAITIIFTFIYSDFGTIAIAQIIKIIQSI